MNEIDYNSVSKQILDEVVKLSFRQFLTKIEVGSEDIVAAVVEELRERSLMAILDTTIFYRQISKDEGFLFPYGTRFLFNRGNYKVVVLEQPPQIRTLSIDANVSSPVAHVDEHRYMMSGNGRYNLAMPYVVFIVVVPANSGKLDHQSLYVYFRNEPLSELTDTLYQAVFSNLDEANCVCTPAVAYKSGDSANAKIESLIAQFWQSTFNRDLATNWHTKENIDPRLKLEHWVQHTQMDPLFMCEVSWKKAGSLLGEMEHALRRHEDRDHNIVRGNADDVKEHFDSLVNDMSVDLAEKLKRYLATEKLEKFYPRSVEKDLSAIAQSIVGEMEIVVRKLVKELACMKEQLKRQGNKIEWENWSDSNTQMWS